MTGMVSSGPSAKPRPKTAPQPTAPEPVEAMAEMPAAKAATAKAPRAPSPETVSGGVVGQVQIAALVTAGIAPPWVEQDLGFCRLRRPGGQGGTGDRGSPETE